jgi:hypothetical protein
LTDGKAVVDESAEDARTATIEDAVRAFTTIDTTPGDLSLRW